MDVSDRGRLRFEGADAATFLHALVSNDVIGLPAGRGVYAVYLTPQGRMIADLRLLREDGRVLAEVPAGLAASLQTRFDQLIFAEAVAVCDDTSATRAALVAGSKAAAVVAEVAGVDAALIEALPVLGHTMAGTFRVVRTDEIAEPNFQVWAPVDEWDALTRRLSDAGTTPVSADLINALRIAAARPRFGIDMTEDTIPLEAGLLDRAISMSKGCYVGQEVIVRVLHRGGGRVVKHLVQMTFGADVVEAPPAGTRVLAGDDGKDVGVVTSAAQHPATGRMLALAWVHRDAAEVGRVVRLATGAGATVTAFAA